MIDPFYADGLRFGCLRCSGCCTGESGYVFLSAEDLDRLLRRLGLDFASFYREYCLLVDTGTGMALSLKESTRRAAGGGLLSRDCVFWAKEGCAVYGDRPVQCSTYPFWSSVLDSSGSWQGEARSCPGIGRGETRSRADIEECLLARRRSRTIVLDYGVDPESADADTILGSSRLGPDAPDAVEG
jgi:uncharacterized protein